MVVRFRTVCKGTEWKQGDFQEWNRKETMAVVMMMEKNRNVRCVSWMHSLGPSESLDVEIEEDQGTEDDS